MKNNNRKESRQRWNWEKDSVRHVLGHNDYDVGQAALDSCNKFYGIPKRYRSYRKPKKHNLSFQSDNVKGDKFPNVYFDEDTLEFLANEGNTTLSKRKEVEQIDKQNNKVKRGFDINSVGELDFGDLSELE